MFQTKVVEKKHIFCVQFCFSKNLLYIDNVEKYGIAGLATDDNKALAPCMLDT
jgi:hypothetical protein